MTSFFQWLSRVFSPESIVQWCVAILAGFALFFANGQIQAARETAYETYALGAFQKYNEYRMQYPKLALGLVDPSSDVDDALRYGPFFHSLAVAGEAILTAYPDSKEWTDTIGGHLSIHCRALSAHFTADDIATYHDRFQRVFTEVRQSCRFPERSN